MVKRLNVKYLIQDTSSNWTTENPTMSEGVIAYESETNKMKIFDGEKAFNDLAYVGGEGSSGGTNNYNLLTNKPQINSIELSGNKSLAELGIQAKGDYATKSELASKADTSALSSYATTEAMNSALANKADTSALDGKANKSTTLNGYGITDAYTKAEVDGKLANKADTSALSSYATTESMNSALASKADTSALSSYATTESMNSALASKADTSALSSYATTESVSSTYATKSELANKADTSALDGKANKSTTLNGYGITDAYTKSESDGKLTDALADYALKSELPEVPEKLPNPEALTVTVNNKAFVTYDGSASVTQNLVMNAETIPLKADTTLTVAYGLEEVTPMFIQIPLRTLQDKVYDQETIIGWFGQKDIPSIKQKLVKNVPVFVKYGIALSGNPHYYKFPAEYCAFESANQIKLVFQGLNTQDDVVSKYEILINLDGTIIEGNSNVKITITSLEVDALPSDDALMKGKAPSVTDINKDSVTEVSALIDSLNDILAQLRTRGVIA